MNETQESIAQWSIATFGTAGSNLSVAKRAQLEMLELITCLSKDDSDLNAGKEIADVVIILYKLADRMGLKLQTQIDLKMAVNRQRKWDVTKNRHIE